MQATLVIEPHLSVLYLTAMMKRIAALSLMMCCAAPVGAHPHIFVDTGLDLRFDDEGRLTEVKITWAYDEFYSLLITEDRGLDQDFDGEMTAAELEDLRGFDMQWSEGFNGDLVILQGDDTLTLSGPMDATAVYAQGRITTTHVRRVEPGQGAEAPLAIKPYDKTYYTAYDITLPVTIEGTNACRQRIEMPDIEAGLLQVRDQLNAMDQLYEEDAETPDIGIVLTSTVHVTCDIS